jgi:hypothetical protein
VYFFHVKMAVVVSGVWSGKVMALYTEYLVNLTSFQQVRDQLIRPFFIKNACSLIRVLT